MKRRLSSSQDGLLSRLDEVERLAELVDNRADAEKAKSVLISIALSGEGTPVEVLALRASRAFEDAAYRKRREPIDRDVLDLLLHRLRIAVIENTNS